MTLKQSMCVLSALGFILGAGITLDTAQAKSKNQTSAPARGMTTTKNQAPAVKREQTGGTVRSTVSKHQNDMPKIGAGSRSGL
jgi:hypothetical protein